VIRELLRKGRKEEGKNKEERGKITEKEKECGIRREGDKITSSFKTLNL